MTAAPGPQQPDEVRPVWPDDREWVPDDEVTCRYCQRYKNRKVCRCGDPNPPVRPAAPSAQPGGLWVECEESTGCTGPRTEHAHWLPAPTPPPSLSQQRRRAEQDGECETCGLAEGRHDEGAHLRAVMRKLDGFTPAQPVRDTGEGRR